MASRVTWRSMIQEEMDERGDGFDNVVYLHPEPDTGQGVKHWLDKVFDAGYGMEEGCPFTIWTLLYVYFPAHYDGSEWCASVPRNPTKEATRHVGGG